MPIKPPQQAACVAHTTQAVLFSPDATGPLPRARRPAGNWPAYSRASASLEVKESSVEARRGVSDNYCDAGRRHSAAWAKNMRVLLSRMQFDKPNATPTERAFIHGGWADARVKTRSLLARAGIKPNRLQRWDTCGSLAFIERNTRTDALRVKCTRCKDRFCRTCAVRKRRHQVARLMDLLSDGEPVRMITLTLAHGTEPLKAQLDRLYSAFRRLRQRDEWQSHVTAGAAACEIHVGKDNKWHVHLHVLCTGSFWSQSGLSAEWLAVTGDSRIVDIRAMPSDRAINYATKYLSKAVPSDLVNDPEHFIEAVKALTGRRLLIVTGGFVGKLSEKPDENPGEDGTSEPKPSDWIGIGNYENLLSRAKVGDPYAKGIIDALHAKTRWKSRNTASRRRKKHQLGGGPHAKVS